MALSKRNRRGVWVLIALCLGLAYVPRVIAGMHNNSVEVSHEDLKLAEEKVARNQKKKVKKRKYSKKKVYKAPPAKFDPNTYSKQDWMHLGLSEKQADVVLKFTSRGIYSNEELKKIFVIPEAVFELIQDSTFYPIREEFVTDKEFVKKEIKKANLNSASFEELIELPWIGDYTAKKIIEQREKLGGYIGKYQLLEIWGIDAERYDKIKINVFVSGTVRQLNINEASIEELKNHPYINYKVANSIVKMRKVHGDYKIIEDIKRSVLIDQELFTKIQPYLTL